MSRSLKSTALRGALEVKHYGSAGYALYVVELLGDGKLVLTDTYRQTKASVMLTSEHAVSVLSTHGARLVVIEPIMALKMPSEEMAARWAQGLHQSRRLEESAAERQQSFTNLNPVGFISTETFSQAEAAPERYIFKFPVCLMVKKGFPQEEHRSADSKNEKLSYSSRESAVGLASYKPPATSITTEL